MTEPARHLGTAVAAVSVAASMMRSEAPGALTAKGDRDYASEVDYAIERRIREFLADATPEVGFLGEEEGRTGTDGGAWWALDPVDGTVNFAHGVPLCGISLALIRDGRAVLGVVELPFLRARYTAVDGHGAHCDGKPIHASAAGALSEAIVSIGDYAVGTEAEQRNADRLAVTTRLAHTALRVRMFGSAAIDLVWVAEGRTDAMVSLSNKPWDTAAGVVIAREAGAVVVDRDGSPHSIGSSATIAAAPALVDELVGLVQEATAAPLPS